MGKVFEKTFLWKEDKQISTWKRLFILNYFIILETVILKILLEMEGASINSQYFVRYFHCDWN